MDVQKSCQSCPSDCLECQLNSEVTCSKCLEGTELNEGKCSNIATKSNSTQIEGELKIISSSYSDSPSRAKIDFNKEVVIILNISNTNITLKTEDGYKTIETELEYFKLTQNKKSLKVYFTPKSGIQEGKLDISLNQENLIKSLNNESEFYLPRKMEVSPVNFYKPDGEIRAMNTSSTTLSYVSSALSTLSISGSISNVFDIIKTFQMIDFLIFLNVKHPSNLKSLLENLEFKLIEALPNPFANLKDNLCYIEKEKFEEQEVTCYIFKDQGRYFMLTLLIISFNLLAYLLHKTCGCKWIEQKILKNRGLDFWMDFLETIRIDIFMSILLSMTKLRLISNQPVSYLTLNLGVATLMGALNLVCVAYQFYTIRAAYSRFKAESEKRNKKNKNEIENQKDDEEEAQKSIKPFRVSSRFTQRDKTTNPFLNQQDHREIMKKKAKTKSPIKQRGRKKNALIANLRIGRQREIVPSTICAKGKELEISRVEAGLSPSTDINEDCKTHTLYQRHYRPFMGLKDLLISVIIVLFHDFPRSQSLAISFILLTFLILDIYYRPFRDEKKNLKMLITSGVFFMLSSLLMILSFIQDHIRRSMAYYAIGYPCVILVAILLFRSLVSSLATIFEVIKSVYKNMKSRFKVDSSGKVTRPSKIFME